MPSEGGSLLICWVSGSRQGEPWPGACSWSTSLGDNWKTKSKAHYFSGEHIFLNYLILKSTCTCSSDVFLVFCGMLSSQLLGGACDRESPPSRLHPCRSSE